MTTFPALKATVLQDGHIDPITGPRCLVKMDEGQNLGKYQIVHTNVVLRKGTPVAVDFRRHAVIRDKP
jgi:hypothetical protein